MTFDPKEFTDVLLDVILFECASQSKNKHTIRELASAFYNARLLLSFDHNMKSSSSHVYIQEHKLCTTQGLLQYMQSLQRGNNGYFPYPTPVRKPLELDPDHANSIHDDEFVDLPTCSSTDMKDFYSNYAEKVPSAFHDHIAAVVGHLRTCCWDRQRGSGGKAVALSSLPGMMGVSKYSMEYNERERLKTKQSLARIEQLQPFIRIFNQMGKENQERERLERDVGQMRIADEHTAYHQRRQQHIDAVHHGDINLYLDKLKLQAATACTRRRVEALRRILEINLRTHACFRNAEVSLFGSFESGLSTLTSDADFTVSNLVGLSIEPIHDLARALQLSGYGPIKTISNARVPIVTFTGQGIRCDMNINQPIGVFNSQLIHAYQKIDTRFLGLWFGLRSLADKHGILSGSTGYLSSYALTMMLIVFLQAVTSPPILPRLQQQSAFRMITRTIDGYHCAFDKDPRNYTELAAKNTKTQGELLKDFCQYFGNTFNYTTLEVNPRLGVIRNRSVNPPPRSRRDSRPKDWPICVLDPFITDRNVAGNCRGHNVAVIQSCFRTAHDALVKDDIKRAFKV
ncbi:hypothetical protein F5H01DRAFT_344826 [Linnemannia elongata]|nr:hypothetical protein F5H01DRAFT_344826 [Linnemannia elongata]